MSVHEEEKERELSPQSAWLAPMLPAEMEATLARWNSSGFTTSELDQSSAIFSSMLASFDPTYGNSTLSEETDNILYAPESENAVAGPSKHSWEPFIPASVSQPHHYTLPPNGAFRSIDHSTPHVMISGGDNFSQSQSFNLPSTNNQSSYSSSPTVESNEFLASLLPYNQPSPSFWSNLSWTSPGQLSTAQTQPVTSAELGSSNSLQSSIINTSDNHESMDNILSTFGLPANSPHLLQNLPDESANATAKSPASSAQSSSSPLRCSRCATRHSTRFVLSERGRLVCNVCRLFLMVHREGE